MQCQFYVILTKVTNIDVNKIEALITEKTKVIIPVHFSGILVIWMQLKILQQSTT